MKLWKIITKYLQYHKFKEVHVQFRFVFETTSHFQSQKLQGKIKKLGTEKFNSRTFQFELT